MVTASVSVPVVAVQGVRFARGLLFLLVVFLSLSIGAARPAAGQVKAPPIYNMWNWNEFAYTWQPDIYPLDLMPPCDEIFPQPHPCCGPCNRGACWPSWVCWYGSMTGTAWPAWGTMFYGDLSKAGVCDPFGEFIHYPDMVTWPLYFTGVYVPDMLAVPGLMDPFGTPIEEPPQFGLPNHSIALKPIEDMRDLREIRVPCQTAPTPPVGAARFELPITEGQEPWDAECFGAVFIVAAFYDDSVYDVRLAARYRDPTEHRWPPFENVPTFEKRPLLPWQPRMIIDEFIDEQRPDLRYADMIASPLYVEVRLRPGRSLALAKHGKVTLAVYSVNWAGGTDNCFNLRDHLRFNRDQIVEVGAFSLEMPEDLCMTEDRLSPADALEIGSIPTRERQEAASVQATTMSFNDLAADLPGLRVGHNRFQTGRTLAGTLGTDARWYFSGAQTVDFVAFNLPGHWCAVEDIPGWTWTIEQGQLVVADTCEGLSYRYDLVSAPEARYRLASVRRGTTTVRTYIYSPQGVLARQIEGDGSNPGANRIDYNRIMQGEVTILSVLGTSSLGETRTILASFGGDGSLLGVTAPGGPSRGYQFINEPEHPSRHGLPSRVTDPSGYILLGLEYDESGRLVQTWRGPNEATRTTLSRHERFAAAYFVPEAWSAQLAMFGREVESPFNGDDVLRVDGDVTYSSCYLDDTRYLARAHTVDFLGRPVWTRQWSMPQTWVRTPESPTEPPWLGTPHSVRFWYDDYLTGMYIPGAHYFIEKEYNGRYSDYTVFDDDFNAIRTFRGDPAILDYNYYITYRTPLDELIHTYQRFDMPSGSGETLTYWQVASTTDAARDSALTSLEYYTDPSSPSFGLLKRRTSPTVSGANNPSGVAVPPQIEDFSYAPTNKMLVTSLQRRDRLNNVIDVTFGYDTYDYPSTVLEKHSVTPSLQRLISMEHNAFGQRIKDVDPEGYVTRRTYDAVTGLTRGEHVYAIGQTGKILRQTRMTYHANGANQGRLSKVEIADHVGPFDLNAPAAWQVTVPSYDAAGRITSKILSHTVRPQTYTWGYGYDLQDRVVTTTYPGGTWVRTVYEDPDGARLDEVGQAGSSDALMRNYYWFDHELLGYVLNETAPDRPDSTYLSYDYWGRRVRRDESGYPTVYTEYEYNAGRDVLREFTYRYDNGQQIESDIRRDFDEYGRAWREQRLADPAAGPSATLDAIVQRQFDLTGNETEVRVTDVARGNGVTRRSFDWLNFPQLEQVQLTGGSPPTWAYTTTYSDRRGNVLARTDAEGRRVERTYDALSRPVETRFYDVAAAIDSDIAPPAVPKLRIITQWTSLDKKASDTKLDPNGGKLDQQRWEYDGAARESRWARMANPASTGAVNTAVDMVVDSTSDGVGRRTSRTEYDGGVARVTEMLIDGLGRVYRTNHPKAGYYELFDYHPNPSQHTSFRQRSRTTIDGAAAGTVLETTYDTTGRLSREEIKREDGWSRGYTTYEFDSVSRLIRTDEYDSMTGRNVRSRSTYDGLGRLTRREDAVDQPEYRRVDFGYYQRGELATVTALGAGPSQVTTYSYDLAGRRTQVTHPDASTTIYTFDGNGRVRTRRSEDSFITYYVRDWRGRVVEKRQTNSSGAILEQFGYDPLGRLTLASVGPVSTSQNKTMLSYGNGGSLGPAYSDEPVSESQTVWGITKTVQRSLGTRGLPTSLTYPTGSGQALLFSYDECGDLLRIDRNSVRYANFEYHGRRPTWRQVRTTQAGPEVWVEQLRTLDDWLRMPREVSSNVRTGSTGGQGGTVSQIMGFTTEFDFWRNPTSQTAASRPLASENGVHELDYDLLQRLTGLDYPDTSHEGWVYDDLGNREQHDPRFGSPVSYSHNSLNQYTSITGGATPLHDLKGNLVRDERGNGYEYDFENRLRTVFSDLDADGQHDPGEPVWADYTYDALGRRNAVTISGSTALRYYDRQRCIAEFALAAPATPSRLFFNGPDGIDDHLSVQVGTGGPEYYFLQKELGTVAGIADAAGQLFEWYVYGGYGLPAAYRGTQPVADLATSPNPFLFTGQRLDALHAGQLLLYDYKAREYDPLHGRFTQRDPRSVALGLPSPAHDVMRARGGAQEQGLAMQRILWGAPLLCSLSAASTNPYTYAENSPWSLMDPEGLEFTYGGLGMTMGIGAALGALFGGIAGSMDGGGWRGFLKGAVIGAIAGGLGGGAGYAFAASASGILASLFGESLIAPLVASGVVSGAVSSGISSALNGNSLRTIAADMFFGGLVGGLTGLVGAGFAGKAEALLPMEKQLMTDTFREAFGEAWEIIGGVLGGSMGAWFQALRERYWP